MSMMVMVLNRNRNRNRNRISKSKLFCWSDKRVREKGRKKRRLEPTNDRTNERMNKYWNVVFAANERNSELCIYYLAMRVPFPYCSFVRIDFAHHLHISIISFHCSRSVPFRFPSFCNQHWENLIFNHSIFSGCIRVDLPISNWDSFWWNIYTHSYIVEIFAWHQTRKDG